MFLQHLSYVTGKWSIFWAAAPWFCQQTFSYSGKWITFCFKKTAASKRCQVWFCIWHWKWTKQEIWVESVCDSFYSACSRWWICELIFECCFLLSFTKNFLCISKWSVNQQMRVVTFILSVALGILVTQDLLLTVVILKGQFWVLHYMIAILSNVLWCKWSM